MNMNRLITWSEKGEGPSAQTVFKCQIVYRIFYDQVTDGSGYVEASQTLYAALDTVVGERCTMHDPRQPIGSAISNQCRQTSRKSYLTIL